VPQEQEMQQAAAAPRVGMPGLLPASAVAVLSAIGFWLWVASGGSLGTLSTPAVTPTANELAEVSKPDLTGALGTMSGSESSLAQFKARADGCRAPLAWVAIAHAPGQPNGTARLRVGDYFSPQFEVTETWQRLAIPYPGAYETGHGALTVLSSGKTVTLALTPPWTLPPEAREATREVSWRPIKRCAGTNG
jgi:hypothetical protein